MLKRLFIIMAVFFALALAGSALAIPPGTTFIISYDGYLQMTVDPASGAKTIYGDTLIVVTNSHPAAGMTVLIEVFDKYGTQQGPGVPQGLLNGATVWPGNIIPANGSGWIALGQIVTRTTTSPYGDPAVNPDGLAEKFSFRIYTNKAGQIVPPVVEVKQGVYKLPVTLDSPEAPYYGIWEPGNFEEWTETSLGGKNGTGVIWQAP